MTVPGSILGGHLQHFFFFIKFGREKIVSCRQNGIDRLRNGQLRRRS